MLDPMAEQSFTRRAFLATPALAAAATTNPAPLKLSIFSKHLQWADWKEMAETAAGMGFEGIDLTVRAGGHVLPERVAEDLPKAAEAIRAAGIALTMITTDIVDPNSPHAEAVLKTASALGVRNYRWGGFKYTDAKPIAEQLAAFKPRVKALSALNQRYNMCAMYHTHSGVNQVGAAQWDLWTLLKDEDPRYVSFNYDIGHATIEGGLGGWIHSARVTAPFMRGVALKDFTWVKSDKGWNAEWCPIGKGMVNLPKFLGMLREQAFNGPLQIHYEYKTIGGADSGKRTLTILKDEVIAQMRRDVSTVKRLLKDAQLA